MRVRKKLWLLPLSAMMAVSGGLVVLSQGETGTLRCRTLFGGGVSLQVGRWPVNDFRGRTPRTFMILGGVDYLREGGPPAP